LEVKSLGKELLRSISLPFPFVQGEITQEVLSLSLDEHNNRRRLTIRYTGSHDPKILDL
jgi:hypothetical protein